VRFCTKNEETALLDYVNRTSIAFFEDMEESLLHSRYLKHGRHEGSDGAAGSKRRREGDAIVQCVLKCSSEVLSSNYIVAIYR
jgi:hypothetical protein